MRACSPAVEYFGCLWPSPSQQVLLTEMAFVVWPIMIVLALTMNFPWRLVGLYVLGFVCAASLYRIGYKAIPPTHAHPLDSIQKPLQVLEYMEKYLGGAAVANTHLDWAVQIGQLGLTIAVVLIFWLIIRREKVSLLEFRLSWNTPVRSIHGIYYISGAP